jgi:hypothetical protein
MSIFNGITYLKATAITGLAALSMSDVLVAHSYARPTVVHPIVCQRVEKPFVYDAAEDRTHWSAKYGREISEVEHLEIHANLVEFMHALMAPTLRAKRSTGEGLQ